MSYQITISITCANIITFFELFIFFKKKSKKMLSYPPFHAFYPCKYAVALDIRRLYRIIYTKYSIYNIICHMVHKTFNPDR